MIVTATLNPKKPISFCLSEYNIYICLFQTLGPYKIMNEHNIKIKIRELKQVLHTHSKDILYKIRMVCQQSQMGEYRGAEELKIPLNNMLSDIITLD